MKTTLVLALLSLALPAVFAQAPMAPDPMLKQLDRFAGNWQCKGSDMMDPKMTHHYTSTVEAMWTLGGHWMTAKVNGIKSSDNPMPMSGVAQLGYDVQSKHFVLGWVDNMGGYATADGPGFMNNSFTFTGPNHIGGMTATGRDVFTWQNAKTMEHVFELEEHGAWRKVGDETCTKK